MVGVRTRNRGVRKTTNVFNTRTLGNKKSNEPKARMSWNGTRRVATRKPKKDDVENQTKKATRKNRGESMTSISTQSETVSERDSEWQKSKERKLEETIRLLTEELLNKDKKISDNETIIERMERKEKEMEKRDSEKSKEMEKVKHELEETKKQGSTPMNSVGTKGGRITKISELTGQTLTGFTKAELTSFRTRVEKEQMKQLVAAVESIINVYCRKEIFPKYKFLNDDMAIMALNIGYGTKKISVGSVTKEQLLLVGPKLVHQGVARWRKNAQNQAMNNYKGKNEESVSGV